VGGLDRRLERREHDLAVDADDAHRAHLGLLGHRRDEPLQYEVVFEQERIAYVARQVSRDGGASLLRLVDERAARLIEDQEGDRADPRDEQQARQQGQLDAKRENHSSVSTARSAEAPGPPAEAPTIFDDCGRTALGREE
jgi:hypothetical protein